MEFFKGAPHKFQIIKGHVLMKKSIDGHLFIIAFSLFKKKPLGPLYLVMLLISLTIVHFMLYFIIRRMIHPVCHLMTGVENIQNGDFSYYIPVNNEDELGRLAASFNRMTQLIKEMLQSKDRLLLDVSHELRSPITRMKLACEFLKDDKIKKSLQDDLLEMETMIFELFEPFYRTDFSRSRDRGVRAGTLSLPDDCQNASG